MSELERAAEVFAAAVDETWAATQAVSEAQPGYGRDRARWRVDRAHVAESLALEALGVAATAHPAVKL